MSDDWIPVKQRLPDIGQRFDAWMHGRYSPDHGAYVGSWDDDFRRESMLLNGITHWKPLPKAPSYDYKPCETASKNGGNCPLHNLHCGYPDCTHIPFNQPPTIES